MRSIQLDEQLFDTAQRRAAEAGFPNVDAYVADVLQQSFEEPENLDHLFTPERLAIIDRAVAEIDAGLGLSLEQVEARLAQHREEWLRRKS